MTYFERIVPVKLIAGKEYVMRNGRHVYVEKNPHWHRMAKFPFYVAQRHNFIYLTQDGKADPEGGENAYDIIRPAYKKGEVYLDRNSNRRVISIDNGSPVLYPLVDEEQESWTRGGRVCAFTLGAREGDLMDYEHRELPMCAPGGDLLTTAPQCSGPIGAFATAPTADPWIGKRVKFNDGRKHGTGIVRGLGYSRFRPYVIEVDDSCLYFEGGHNCESLVPSGRGWFVFPEYMTIIDSVESKAQTIKRPTGLFDYVPKTESWVGKRVHFTEDGRSGTGLVLREVENISGWYEVRADSPFAGIGTGGLKWYVWEQNMRIADANTVVPSIVHDVSPDLPILATPITTSRVGMRVEVQLDCATTVQATIMHEDATHVVIEFDPDYCHAGAWTCNGHVPSGRGWYVPKDSVRAVSEDETQVEAERSEAEALNEVDVAEVWVAYRINPSISIDAWIAARRVLKAAAK